VKERKAQKAGVVPTKSQRGTPQTSQKHSYLRRGSV
jgi:hypothetical protein